MKTVSIAVDDKVWAHAQTFATLHNTSLDSLVVDYLADLGSSQTSTSSARERLIELSSKSTGEVGTRSWTRDDLYGR